MSGSTLLFRARAAWRAAPWRLFFSPLVSTALPCFFAFFAARSIPYFFRKYWRKSVASTCTIVFFTRVFVRTSSLFDALYTVSLMRHFRVQFSEPQEKLPESSRSARTFVLPPRQRTRRTRFWPIFVIAAGRASSNFRFFWWIGRLPPVARCLWRLSRVIPIPA